MAYNSEDKQRNSVHPKGRKPGVPSKRELEAVISEMVQVNNWLVHEVASRFSMMNRLMWVLGGASALLSMLIGTIVLVLVTV